MNSMPSLTMNNDSGTPMPACKIRTLQDGSVRIQCGEPPLAYVGIVSSHHLVEPKINQLQQYWVKAQEAYANQPHD